MNITQLKQIIDAALERGIDPETAVVIDVQSVTNGDVYDWAILETVIDPTEHGDRDGYTWLTLRVGEEADPQFTPGHGY